MKTYMYKTKDQGARGYNRTIVVYRIIKNQPILLGYNDKINTAVTYGDKGEAVQLISLLCGHKHNSYEFESKNIRLFGV